MAQPVPSPLTAAGLAYDSSNENSIRHRRKQTKTLTAGELGAQLQTGDEKMAIRELAAPRTSTVNKMSDGTEP